MLLSLKKVKKIFLWIVINLVISVIFFVIKSVDSGIPCHLLYARTAIITFTISSLSVLAGYCTSRLVRGKSHIIEIPLVLLAVLCASIAGNAISQYILGLLFANKIHVSVFDNLFLLLIITLTVAIITIKIEHLTIKKDDLEKYLKNIEGKINRGYENEVISIKEEDAHHVIKFSKLVYLSSHGKKSTLHTTDKDYAINQLLKDIEEKLPSDIFIRVHKQFIINIKYLKQIKYYKGGRYTAYLNDEDESTIPVGRNIVPFIKEKLAI